MGSVVLVTWAFASLVIGCGEVADDTEIVVSRGHREFVAPLSGQSSYPSAFRHPLQASIEHLGGAVPLLDVKDDPATGQRFAVGDVILGLPDGSITQFSGVTTLSDDTVGDVAPIAAKAVRTRRVYAAPVIESDFLVELSRRDPAAPVDALVRVERAPSYVPISQRMERSIANGRATTMADRNTERAAWLALQQTHTQATLDLLVPELVRIGVRITARCRLSPCLAISATPSQLVAVSRLADVARIDEIGPSHLATISGAAVSKGTQMTLDTPNNEQFQEDEYLGDKNSSAYVRAGLIDLQKLDTDHPGFLDTANPASTRILSTKNCTSTACSNTTWGTPGGDHGTAKAGLLVGDITDGQDSTITSATERIRRSGYGREALLRYWRVDGSGGWTNAFDDIAASDVTLVSVSAYGGGSDSTCTGTTSLSQTVNDLYEAGVLPIVAAGNAGHSSTTDCRVEHPWSAMGAFVVGGHTGNWTTQDQTDVRFGSIHYASSRGGTVSEGGSRTIVDLTAAGCRDLQFSANGAYDEEACGTSTATPTVGGGAIEFIDWYRDNLSDAIDEPRSLATNLMLMGDRQADGSGKMTSNCNNLWGCGRFKMRRYDDQGMDGPTWGYGSLNTCIDDGETYYYNLNGGAAISSDTDALKVVAFWYDSRHGAGTDIDDIDIYLQKKVGSYWYTVRNGAHSSDEKERIFWDDFSGNYAWRIKFYGWDVTADSAGCGTNSMRVQFAFMFEDSDRETAEYLADIDPEDQ